MSQHKLHFSLLGEFSYPSDFLTIKTQVSRRSSFEKKFLLSLKEFFLSREIFLFSVKIKRKRKKKKEKIIYRVSSEDRC